MRRSRRLRQSVDNILAEERREWQRQTLPMGPVRRPPRGPISFWGNVARQGLVLLGSVVAGAAGGIATDDRATGIALGIATGIVLEAVIAQRD